MKKLSLHHFAILPLLALMATSPMELEKSFPARSIASEVVKSKVESEHPLYDRASAKISREIVLKDKEQVIEKISLIKEEIKCLQDSKDEVDRKEKIQAVVVESILIQESIKSLSLDQDMKLVILDIEKLLEPEAEIVSDEPKKDEEEPKAAATCEHEEKNILLTSQVSQLMDDQKKIMDTVLGMAQMMVNMFQQQQQFQMSNSFPNNNFGLYGQSPYQYHAPVAAGNWVYYPSGFQPGQSNIFQQQAPLMAPPAPLAPQAYQQYQQPQQQLPEASWNLKPEMSFQEGPLISSFGSNPNYFNFQNAI